MFIRGLQIVGVLLLIVIVLAAGSFAWGRWRSNQVRQVIEARPSVRLSVLINGEEPKRVRKGMVNITLDDELTPLVEVDWKGREPGTVRLTMGGREIQPGQTVRAQNQGVATLVATATPSVKLDNGMVFDNQQFLTLEITKYPRYTASLSIVSITADEGPDGFHNFAVTAQLSCDAFDIENIWLSHVSLWLSNREALSSLRLSVEQVRPAAEQEHESDEPTYNARFEDGIWILHFRMSPGKDPLEVWPDKASIFGSGWIGDQTIEFTTGEIPLEPESRP